LGRFDAGLGPLATRLCHLPFQDGMSIGGSLLMRTFGVPRGLLGRLGGVVLARMNRRYVAWAVGLLAPQPQDRVLEIGFGPGVGIDLLAASAYHIAGADPSGEMLRQATKRNAAAISKGSVELCQASADRLPFPDDSFDKALAVNSMQLWPDKPAGLRELSSRSYSSQGRDSLADVA
jgi:SAM-dependent methyltransferase